MFNFLKKLFGFGKTEDAAAECPYKVETVVETVKSVADVNKDGKVDLADAKVVVNKAATQVAKGAQTVAKKTAPKKPQGQKPAGQKKPAQPKTQSGQKPAGNKPRGRRPKAKPATPQQ